MFRIPAFHQMNIGFEEACAMLACWSRYTDRLWKLCNSFGKDHAQRDAGHDDGSLRLGRMN